MPQDEPSNAVLETKLNDVGRRLEEQDKEAGQFRQEVRDSIHNIENLIRAEVDRVIERVHGLDLRAEANKTAIENARAVLTDRQNAQDRLHQEEQKSARFRTGAIIAAVTAASTLAAAAVTIAVIVR